MVTRKRIRGPNKTEKGKVLVRSKAYGNHYRAARGSKTPVEINSSLKENGERMIGSNAPAKLIFDALKPFRKNFNGGMFWQDLLKYFTTQAKMDQAYHMTGFVNRDVDKNYPISRIMALKVDPIIELTSLTMTINIKFVMVERFLKRCPT